MPMFNKTHVKMAPRWATLKDAAAYCGLSTRLIQLAYTEGLVETSLVRRTGAKRGRRLINLQSLDQWIEDGIGGKSDLPHLRNSEVETDSNPNTNQQ